MSLARVLHPQTVAIVGVSERSAMADNVIRTLESGVEVYFVHPREESIFGKPVYRSLAELPVSPDCVFTATSAAHVVETVRQAAEVKAGGVVTIAAGFAESGGDGVSLQEQMVAHATAGGVPVIGPNGIGLVDVRRGLSLTMLAPFERRAGGASVVAHSGALIEAMAAAAYRAGGLGFNLMISAGNEPVTDLADYLAYLADDPSTSVILLAYEKIRRPDVFFAAAARARQNGKPIVAIKLGKSERSQRVAASHTGTVTGDSWAYDVAMRQAGILQADDIDDLIDRAQLLERLPRERWSRLDGLAVIGATGGFAQIAGDIAPGLGIDLPELESLQPFLKENIPGVGDVANPLDSTTYPNGVPGLWEKIVRAYEASDEVDALYFANQHEAWDIKFRTKSDGFAEVARESGKPFVLAPLAGEPARWVEEYEDSGVVIGNGITSTLKGLAAMGEFVRGRADARVRPASEVDALERPEGAVVETESGRMLGFAATMTLLASSGLTVAPYALVGADEPVVPPGFEGPYVVKLADVPHRTDVGAVRVGVTADELESSVTALRALAADKGLPSTVAVQAMVAGLGEVFAGVTTTELGPAVAFGLGGIFVEVLGRVGGRLAPLSPDDARELVAEFDDLGVMDGLRGAPAWNKEAVITTLVAVGRLAAAGRDWIDSLDLNPLIVTPAGPVVVDGLLLLQEEGR